MLLGVPAAAASVLVLPRLTALAGPAAPSALAGDQTPVDIVTADVVAPPGQPRLFVHYPASVDLDLHYVNKDGNAGCGIRDHEETVEAEVPGGAAWVHYDGVRYDLLQFHFHTPSEHTVNGHTFPLEQHFVHADAAGNLLVLGLFLRGGGLLTPQDRVLHTLPAECGGHLHLAGVNLRASLPIDLHTYRYQGSLTTDPFTTGVRWHVLRTPKRVRDRTIARFQGLFPDGNSREVQPLGDRVITLGQGHLV
ncbi:MAG TPA: carbonic anhydrase family protein [Pseudonocardiaceae bacterium]